MNLQTLFPTPFVQIENPYLAARVRPLINTILDDPQYHSSIMNYTSTFDPMNKIEDQIELAQPLVSMKEYLFDLGVAFLNQAGYQTDLMQLGCELHFNRINPGQSHQKHLHSGNIVASGTFYVDFPTGSSPLVLHDPRLHREMVSYPMRVTEWSKRRHYTELRTGSICIMEGYLHHEVETNSTNGRTVVLFNLVN